jgi:hypothetical protein
LTCSRQLLVDLGDHAFDRRQHVAADQLGLRQRLLRQRQHRLLDRGLGLVGLGLEFLVQQRGKLAALEGDALQRRGLQFLGFGHGGLLCS